MSDLQAEMNRVVQGFVAQITELARRAAVDTLQAALGGKRRNGRRVTDSLGRRGRRGEKRSSEDLERLAEGFIEFVIANPGQRIEQINKKLGTTTKDLALPIRKLIADGVVASKGTRRATTYFPAKRGKKN